MDSRIRELVKTSRHSNDLLQWWNAKSSKNWCLIRSAGTQIYNESYDGGQIEASRMIANLSNHFKKTLDFYIEKRQLKHPESVTRQLMAEFNLPEEEMENCRLIVSTLWPSTVNICEKTEYVFTEPVKQVHSVIQETPPCQTIQTVSNYLQNQWKVPMSSSNRPETMSNVYVPLELCYLVSEDSAITKQFCEKFTNGLGRSTFLKKIKLEMNNTDKVDAALLQKIEEAEKTTKNYLASTLDVIFKIAMETVVRNFEIVDHNFYISSQNQTKFADEIDACLGSPIFSLVVEIISDTLYPS